jgi:hypothetical protein
LTLEDVVGKEAIQSQMCRLFEDAISGDRWDEKRLKFGYSRWMDDRLNDVLYFTKLFLEK